MKHTHITSKRIGAFLLIASISGTVGLVARAQSGAPDTLPYTHVWAGDLVVARSRLNLARDTTHNLTEETQNEQKLGALMRSAVGNKARTGFLAQTWRDEQGNEAQSFTVLQNQKLIEQNAEIIALLKAKK